MNILYDQAMPYASVFFSSLGNAKSFDSQQLSADDLVGVDALIVRSTVKVNAELLYKANCLKYVATATAGYNHIDTDYLVKHNISWYSAGGCNAIAVAQYVLSIIMKLVLNKQLDLTTACVGIVGAGNVGTAVSHMLAALNVKCLLCDPPRAQLAKQSADDRHYVGLDDIMSCDLISLHTPLIVSGPFPTLHMFDHDRLSQLTPKQVLINACRGEVIDNKALLTLFRNNHPLNIVLDVWENEPHILTELIPHVMFSSAHIAGHTLEGKARGTSMVYEQLCAWTNQHVKYSLEAFLPLVDNDLSVDGDNVEKLLAQLVFSMYDIAIDDRVFRQRMAESPSFAQIRKEYPIRREFSAQTLNTKNKKLASIARNLGFQIAN